MDRTASPAGRDESERLAATEQVIEVRLYESACLIMASFLTVYIYGITQNVNIHDSSLISHLNLIDSLKSDITPQNVSQILDSAQNLVRQFALLKEQLVSYAS